MFWSPFPLPPSVSPPLCLLAYDIWLPAHPPISKSANPPCPKSDSFFFWEGGVNSRKVLGNLWSVCFRCLLISSGSSLCNLEIKTWMTLDAVAAQLITWVHANTHTQRGKASTSINLCVHARARRRAHGPTGYPDMKSQRDVLFGINKLWHATAAYLTIAWWNVYSWTWP